MSDFLKDLFGVIIEHNCGNISPTICTNMLIFGKDAFLILIFRKISKKTLQNSFLRVLNNGVRSSAQPWIF